MYVYFYITIAICSDYINQNIGWVIICGFDLFKRYCASIQSHYMVHPKIYVHISRFVAFCRDLVSDDFSPYFSIASLALGQSYNCHGASKTALTNMGNWSKCDTLICNNPWNSAEKNNHVNTLYLFSVYTAYRQNRTLGPFLLKNFHHTSNVLALSFWSQSHPNPNKPIAIWICTWHKRCAIATCVKICSDILAKSGITVTWISHPFWIVMKNALVIFVFVPHTNGSTVDTCPWMGNKEAINEWQTCLEQHTWLSHTQWTINI